MWCVKGQGTNYATNYYYAIEGHRSLCVHHGAELVVVEPVVPVPVVLLEAGVHVGRAQPEQCSNGRNEFCGEY